MINFTVIKVENKSDLLAFYPNGSVNGWSTLENMTRYALSQNASNKSIYCHASGFSIFGDYWDNDQYRLTDMATNSTFCRNVSAMLFIDFPGKSNYLPLVRGLGTTFGAANHFMFTEEDKQAMNKTFMILKCSEAAVLA
ncbi:hypothetical protein MTO96_032036 [Rhipicephalus appendiculatus]